MENNGNFKFIEYIVCGSLIDKEYSKVIWILWEGREERRWRVDFIGLCDFLFKM